MSDLRDARLRRALESAPDADQRPDQETRRAVLEAARKAVAPPPRVRWWARLWQGMGERSLPWNAALATVVLATLVTVLWREREIPAARPEVAPPSEPAPTAQAPAMAPPAQPVAPAAPPAKAAPVRERRAEVAVEALRDREVGELAKSGSAPPPSEPGTHSDLAAAGRASSPPAAAPAMSRAESTAAPHWTHVRIIDQGRSLELTREQASRLAPLLNEMAREARSGEPLAIAATQRVELMREGELAGVIELAGPQVRWTPAGRGSFTARPEEARLQALREEIGRALQR
jgi:hypothetical protein